MVLFQENGGRIVMAWSVAGMLIAATLSIVFGADVTGGLMG
jgi:hypothetical protein